MLPMTPLGKVIGGLVAFIGICTVARPVGIVSSGFIEELNRKRRQATVPTDARACPHCGGVLDS
jgi:voltage-gated potassium channel